MKDVVLNWDFDFGTALIQLIHRPEGVLANQMAVWQDTRGGPSSEWLTGRFLVLDESDVLALYHEQVTGPGGNRVAWVVSGARLVL